ncbi:MAG: S1 RNA-binding domain-containing protein, partial [Chloroflexi bacterium]|nr:S1 RNA-binding domain-containing protein [Chloroflexota bacterium]
MPSLSSSPATPAEPGQRLVGIVTRVRPYALAVRLPQLNDRSGIVRQRELSWEQPSLDPVATYHEDDELPLVVLHDPGDGLLELSLRRAVADPWEKWGRALRVGQTVRGTVVTLREFGAFIELKPGLQALLPSKEIAPWRVDRPEDVLWMEDVVEAVITRLETQRRRVQVSLRARMDQIVSGRAGGGRPPSPDSAFIQSATAGPVVPEARLIRRVLVVDDEKALREPLLDLLRRAGREADGADNPDDGARLGIERSYDAVFMDVHFSATLDGHEAGARILAEHPTTLMVFMSGLPMSEPEFEQLWEAGATEVLLKPLAEDDWLQLLTRLERGEVRPGQPSGLIPRPAPAPVASPVAAPLTEELSGLCQRVKASATAVFRMDRQTREV